MTIASTEQETHAFRGSGFPRKGVGLTYSAGVGVFAAVVYWVLSPTLIDDAYITLSYAKNFGLHLHWGLVPSLIDNTATSPLHVLALAVLTAIFRNGVFALGVSFVLCAVGTEYGLRRLARRVGLPRWTGLLATVWCLLNPLVLSTVGMEVLSCAALTALLLVASIERRPWAFGVLTGLLMVLRPDYLIIPMVVFVLRRQWWRGWHKSLCAAFLVGAAWYVPSWFLLGSAIPDTLVIKSLQQDWEGYSFGAGPSLYWQAYPAATVLTFVPAVAGVAAWLAWASLRSPCPGLRRLDPLAALPIAALAHYCAYSALGVPPYHWYYGPTVVLTTIFAAGALGFVIARPRLPWGAAWRSAAVVAALMLVLVDVAVYIAPGMPRRYAPITTNHAATTTYRQIGLDVARIVGNRPVSAQVEIGIIDYYCSCKMYDYFSDRGFFPAQLARYEERLGPIGRKIMDYNFTHLDRSMRPKPTDFTLTAQPHPNPEAIRNWRISTPWILVPATQWVVLTRNQTVNPTDNP